MPTFTLFQVIPSIKTPSYATGDKQEIFPIFKGEIKNASFSGTNKLCWAFRELIGKLFFLRGKQKHLSSQANQVMILCYEILFL